MQLPDLPFYRCLFLVWLLVMLSACGGGASITERAATGSSADTVQLDQASAPAPAPAPAPVAAASSPSADASAEPLVEPALSVSVPAQSDTSGDIAPVATPEPQPEPVPFSLTPPPADTLFAPVPAAERQYRVADITDLILVTGQSNALGADTDYDPTLDSPDKQVFAFTNDGWQVADLHQVWDLNWFPRGNPGDSPSNNFALHFGKQIASRSPDMVVGVILVTAPGTSIEHWQHGGDFYTHLQSKVVSAINQTPHKSGLDGILWHQGENDAGDSAYGGKLDALIARFRSENWFSADRPFICGETAEFDVVNRQLMALNSNGDIWSACVRSTNLHTQSDGFHFSAAGLRELGRRYAEKYIEMRGR